MNENTISPLDGRYFSKVSFVADYFSEYALYKARMYVEINYLIMLAGCIKSLNKLSAGDKSLLFKIAQEFNADDYNEIKSIEKKTNHDVKALEYYLRNKLTGTNLTFLASFVHLGLTSEDTNNISYAVILSNFLKEQYLPCLLKLEKLFLEKSLNYKSLPMAARTHGQKAVPTTLGKEFAVWLYRLSQQTRKLKTFTFAAKLNGAVGNYNALSFAIEEIDWLAKSKEFIESLGLAWTPVTTQVEGSDSLIDFFDLVRHINNILLDACVDIWYYISLDYLKLKVVKDEVGSSTMPQKVNPIDFENAEGNLTVANGLLQAFSNKLAISRLQRDLSDSTVKRNIGVALGHCILAINSLQNGMGKIEANKDVIEKDLLSDWGMLSEAVQILLRCNGVEKSYELVKELTRGIKLTEKDYQIFIQRLPVNDQIKSKLKKLTPNEYIGLADKLVEVCQKTDSAR